MNEQLVASRLWVCEYLVYLRFILFFSALFN